MPKTYGNRHNSGQISWFSIRNSFLFLGFLNKFAYFFNMFFQFPISDFSARQCFSSTQDRKYGEEKYYAENWRED